MKNAILLCCLFLTGCLSPVPKEPITTYLLNNIPHSTPYRKTSPIILLVLPPDTQPVYNTTQMAYTVKPYQVAFFALNQWAETPAQMLLPLMVQALQNTHYFRAIVTTPYAGRYNYLLATQILQLQQNFVHYPPVVELKLRAQLFRASSNQIVATKLFNVMVPIRYKTPYSGVLAANLATSLFLVELMHFCLAYCVI